MKKNELISMVDFVLAEELERKKEIKYKPTLTKKGAELSGLNR